MLRNNEIGWNNFLNITRSREIVVEFSRNLNLVVSVNVFQLYVVMKILTIAYAFECAFNTPSMYFSIYGILFKTIDVFPLLHEHGSHIVSEHNERHWTLLCKINWESGCITDVLISFFDCKRYFKCYWRTTW